ncbi:MAG: hypothetical protein JWP97_4672 [Labilithrix sp.]|nr:hypothetical protein [Labilithrix sp.]
MRRVRIGTALAAGFLGVAGLAACGSGKLPAPLPYAKQPTSALIVAEFPPPPGRVEMIPARPKDTAVWLDGEWTWEGGRWMWKQGRWVEPPPGAVYSPWTGTRNPLGTYYVAPGTWRDAKGADLPDPPALAAAKTRAGTVIGPDGAEVPATPNVRPENGREGDHRNKGRDTKPPETPSGATATGTEPKQGNQDGGAETLPARKEAPEADAGTE